MNEHTQARNPQHTKPDDKHGRTHKPTTHNANGLPLHVCLYRFAGGALAAHSASHRTWATHVALPFCPRKAWPGAAQPSHPTWQCLVPAASTHLPRLGLPAFQPPPIIISACLRLPLPSPLPPPPSVVRQVPLQAPQPLCAALPAVPHGQRHRVPAAAHGAAARGVGPGPWASVRRKGHEVAPWRAGGGGVLPDTVVDGGDVAEPLRGVGEAPAPCACASRASSVS